MMIKALEIIHAPMWWFEDVFMVFDPKKLCLGYEVVVYFPHSMSRAHIYYFHTKEIVKTSIPNHGA